MRIGQGHRGRAVGHVQKRRLQAARPHHLQGLLPALELRAVVGRVLIGAGKVTHETGEPQTGLALQGRQQTVEPLQGGAQARHAGVHFHMHVDGRIQAAGLRRQALDMPGMANNRREIVLYQGLVAAVQRRAPHQNGRLHAAAAQLHAFFHQGHAQPIGTAGGQRPAYWHNAMAVGVGLDHGTHLGAAGQGAGALQVGR